MIKFIKLKKINIKFSDKGKGIPVVLLHGYLESLNIWDEDRRQAGFSVVFQSLRDVGFS